MTVSDWVEMYIEPGTDIAILGAAFYETLSDRARAIVEFEVEFRKRAVRDASTEKSRSRLWTKMESQWGYQPKLFQAAMRTGHVGVRD